MASLALRVLVLEDHPFQRAVAVNLLRQLGCQAVFEAADGAAALTLLHKVGPVDIALCDLCMDGMDGLQFIQQVSVSQQVGSIIISSFLPADLRRSVQHVISLTGLGFLGDVGKPLRVEVLESLLKKCLQAFEVQSPSPANLELAEEGEVRQALARKQLQANYQPKIDLRTGEVCGVEVLARWLHPCKGVLSPATFMPVLERCALMDRLLFEQMEQALNLQREIRTKGQILNMAFNLQAAQLTSPQLVPRIKAIMARYGATGASLTFELTESGVLHASAVSIPNLVRLRMLGCRLAIDDFGTGFSSLQRLCQLPFNEIKLAAEFVRTLELEPRSGIAISNTLTLGRALGVSVVIEGIETQHQHQHLRQLGCTVGQGYLFARPMSGTQLSHWLGRQKNCA